MKKENPKKPFFSIFVESQIDKNTEKNLQAGEENVTHKYPSDSEDGQPVTKKYPSDLEDPYTKKYPSDQEDGYEVTMAYPSDSDHEGSPI